MTRYLRLYAHFVRFSFSRAMMFRFDFTFRIFMDALWYCVNTAFFWVLFEHTDNLGGWTFDQTFLFLGGVFVADAIQMTLFANNMWMLPIAINNGDLDYHLTRPVSSLFFLSLREFAANSFINLIMAVGIFAWAIVRFPGPLGAGPLTLYVLLLLVGVFLHYSLQLMFLIPTFWMHTSSGLREIFWSVDQCGSRPHTIYRGWTRRILLSLLPLALTTSLPAYGLFTGYSWMLLAHIAGVTACAFVLMVSMWTIGLRSYASASS